MKTQFLRTIIIAVVSLNLLACSSDAKEKAAQAEASNTEEVSNETPKVTRLLAAWAKVNDFNTWKAAYDGVVYSDSTHGLRKILVGTETNDPGHIFVAENITDLDAARAFFQSEEIQAKFEEGGVVGQPELHFMDVVHIGSPVRDNPNRVVVRHKVADWDAWKAVFDAEVPNQAGFGLSLIFLGRDIDDPSMVTVIFVVNDKAKVEARIASAELKALMKQAGVMGEPVIRYYTMVSYDPSYNPGT